MDLESEKLKVDATLTKVRQDVAHGPLIRNCCRPRGRRRLGSRLIRSAHGTGSLELRAIPNRNDQIHVSHLAPSVDEGANHMT